MSVRERVHDQDPDSGVSHDPVGNRLHLSRGSTDPFGQEGSEDLGCTGGKLAAHLAVIVEIGCDLLASARVENRALSNEARPR